MFIPSPIPQILITLCIFPSIVICIYTVIESRKLLNKLEHYKSLIENLKTELHYLNYKYTELFKLSKYSSLELEQLFITSEYIRESQKSGENNTKTKVED